MYLLKFQNDNIPRWFIEYSLNDISFYKHVCYMGKIRDIKGNLSENLEIRLRMNEFNYHL